MKAIRAIRLYGKFVSMHLRCAMQYKVSFALTMLGQFLTSFSALLSVYFLFDRFHGVEGFSFSEVLLCFSVVLLSFSLAECFARGFDRFSVIISNGEFDRILTRPRNEIFQVLTHTIEFSRLGRLVQAVLVLCYALPTSGVYWTVDRVLLLVLMVLGGVALFSGLFLVYAGFCFFTIEGLEFMNIFTDGGREFGSYPMSIYGKELLRFFTFVVPLACVQYYPLLYLLGRDTSFWNYAAPLAGFVFWLPAWLFWRVGVRRYKSTGS